MVMDRLASRQYGGAATGTNYFGGGGMVGGQFGASASLDVGAGSSARWTGIVVLVLLAVVLVGHHGLKG